MALESMTARMKKEDRLLGSTPGKRKDGTSAFCWLACFTGSPLQKKECDSMQCTLILSSPS